MEDTYQRLFETMDDENLDVLKDSLYISGTKWLKTNKYDDKTILRMDLRHVQNVWYQFLKHSLKPTTHNETINKAQLVILHYITTYNLVNVSKIVCQEIQACSKKQNDVIYFPCLIISLCKRK